MLRLRFTVWRTRWRLDAALADGADPSDSAALALRARQLIEPSMRRAIARAIRELLDDAAEDAPECYSPRPPLRRDALFAAHRDLIELARRLRAPQVASPQAVALAEQLVWDSASPAYAADGRVSVARWAKAANEVLRTDQSLTKIRECETTARSRRSAASTAPSLSASAR